MIKSYEEITLKTRETYFLYRKSQKQKISKNVFQTLLYKTLLRFISRLGKSHCAEEKKRKLASYRLKSPLWCFGIEEFL